MTLQKIIPSYLYTQYADDPDLQAFVAAFNQYGQAYIDTFNQLNLPIYTAPNIVGPLLDWVGEGIYGYLRPQCLPGSFTTSVGPLNTYGPNAQVPLNTETSTSGTIIETTDDIYKRLLTWHFYKGDGKQFNIRWLKRRIMRFMIGTNGTAPNIDQTYKINVTFAANNVVNITIPTYAAAPYLAAAIASGVAETPFQFTFNVTVSGSVGGILPWENDSSVIVPWENNSSAVVTWNNYGI